MTLYLIRKVGAGGGVLDGGQRQVHLERLGEELRALRVDAVEAHAASQGRAKVSAAADTLPK